MSVNNLTYSNESTSSLVEDIFMPLQTNLYLSVFVASVTCFGMLTNTLVIYIVVRYNDMHTPINYSFCNLAITDLLFLSVHGIPSIFDGLVFGKHLCRVFYYMRSVSKNFTRTLRSGCANFFNRSSDSHTHLTKKWVQLCYIL